MTKNPEIEAENNILFPTCRGEENRVYSGFPQKQAAYGTAVVLYFY
jgi:hypothetical protein